MCMVMGFNVFDVRLERFLKELEENLSDVKKFRPRYIELKNFLPSNDSDVDKWEEILEDETLILEKMPLNYRVLEKNSFGDARILALDTSSFRIGETERGIVTAYRASIVLFEEDKYRITRFGPFIVNISEENKEYIYNYFRRLLGLEEVRVSDIPMLYKVVDRVRNFIERYLQILYSEYFKDGIILWDGSLTSGTVDTPRRVIESALNRAESHNNAVFGVSKISHLRTRDGYRLIDLLSDVYYPSYIKLNKLIKEEVMAKILGDVYAVRFSQHGFTFRVDIHPRNGFDSEYELKRMFSICPMFNGYPDPLRQAHINCYFTSNEVLALQSYVIEKYHLEVLDEFDVRKFILYPY